MAELKTHKTDNRVDAFLNRVDEEKKRQDSFKIKELMAEVTGEEPEM